jgi:ERCC4-type nuclease
MEKKVFYNEWKDYIIEELSNLNNNYSNIVLEKIKTEENITILKMQEMIMNVNKILKSNIAIYWEWYRYIK